MEKTLALQFDTPWKRIIDKYFQSLLEFLFPHIAREIDWTEPTVHLDKELLEIQKDPEVGERLADKLIQVCKTNGEQMFIIIHLEIQGDYEKEFSQRLFEYYYRIYDRYKKPITTLAILTDKNKNWRPCEYHRETWGCYLTFTFPIIKLIDFISKKEILSRSQNPIAKVIEAHLAALQAGNKISLRFENKLKLVKNLYSLGYTGEDILALYGFIDYAMRLPPDLDENFMTEMRDYEGKINMPYITSAERLGMKRGIEQGIEQGIERGIRENKEDFLLRLLKARSGSVSSQTLNRIQTASVEELDQWFDKLLNNETVECFA